MFAGLLGSLFQHFLVGTGHYQHNLASRRLGGEVGGQLAKGATAAFLVHL